MYAIRTAIWAGGGIFRELRPNRCIVVSLGLSMLRAHLALGSVGGSLMRNIPGPALGFRSLPQRAQTPSVAEGAGFHRCRLNPMCPSRAMHLSFFIRFF